jgi:pimeloyl-ACP methyl ester carboxylesterase
VPTPLLTARGEVVLSDGRRLAYSAAGPRDGFPVLYFHGAIGTPAHRSDGLEAEIARSGIRYLMVDRPGFGGSDPRPGRTVADFASDVEQLADALRFDRFSVVGTSAGAPYALACAWRLPDRMHAAAAVSSIPPGLSALAARGMDLRYRLPLFALGRWPRAIGRLADALIRLVRRRPGLVARVMSAGASTADRNLLADREAATTAARSFLAATARGAAPMVEDYLVVCHRGWGFDPADALGRVHLWHGSDDRLIPLEHVRPLAAALPNCLASVTPNDGHFFFRARIHHILAPLLPARDVVSGTERSADLAA